MSTIIRRPRNWNAYNERNRMALRNKHSQRRSNATVTVEDIPARTAVFETNELLRQIISAIPLESFANLRRVSKTWHSVARDIGYHVSPIRVLTDHSYSYPEYSTTVPILFNPAISCGPRFYLDSPSSGKYEMEFAVSCDYMLSPFGYRNDFLTSPPVTHVSVKGSSVGCHGAVAMVRDPEGIRLQHLAKVFYQLLHQFCSRCRWRECTGHTMSVLIICTRGDTHGVSEEQQSSRRRMLAFKERLKHSRYR